MIGVERIAQSPDRQIMRLRRPLHPGQRGLQPDAIRKLHDQRPAVDVLQGYPGGVQPPVEGIQPGACDRLFDSGAKANLGCKAAATASTSTAPSLLKARGVLPMSHLPLAA